MFDQSYWLGSAPLPQVSWWLVFLFTLGIDWGVIRCVRWLEPRTFRHPHWLSGAYGDVLLPFGLASSYVVAASAPLTGAWYQTRLWYVVVLLLGLAGIAILYSLVLHIFVGRRARLQLLRAPHNIWHGIVFPMMFFVAGVSILPFILIHTPSLLVAVGIVGYGGWIVTELIDAVHPPRIGAAKARRVRAGAAGARVRHALARS